MQQGKIRNIKKDYAKGTLLGRKGTPQKMFHSPSNATSNAHRLIFITGFYTHYKTWLEKSAMWKID